MAEYMKKLVYLTEEQKNTLFANGSITVGSKTITYDPNDVYVTPRDLPDFQVGTVETLPAGSQATASITGTGDTPVINLGIPKGDQGIQGPQGVKGDTGAKGDKGDKGDQGDQGPQGVKGDTGAKGDKGDKGDTGNTGPVGPTPEFTIGTVSTLPAGSSATATITGTPEEPVLNLGIPKGDPGEVTQAEFDALADDVSDMQDTLEHKADINGYYTDMTVGNAEQLVASQYVEDAEPYKFRTSGGSADIGNRAYVDKIVGGTVAWNQQVRDAASENVTEYADVVTVTDAVVDDAAVKVKIEPVQDLHGQDSPWPAGGGVNKFAIADAVGVSPSTGATYGLTITLDNTAETIRIQGTPTWGESAGNVTFRCISTQEGSYYGDAPVSHDYSGMAYKIFPISLSSNVSAISELGISSGMITVTLAKTGNAAIDVLFKIVIATAGTTIGDWSPYANLCPISGWDEVKVYDDQRYGGLVEWNQLGKEINETNFRMMSGTATYENGVATLNPTGNYGRIEEYPCIPVEPNHKYLISVEAKTNFTHRFIPINWRFGAARYIDSPTTTPNEWIEYYSFKTDTSDISNSYIYLGDVTNSYTEGDIVQVRNFQLFDLTECFGAGNEPTTIEEFRSLFHNDYYAYNAGETMTVGQVNGEAYRAYTIEMPVVSANQWDEEWEQGDIDYKGDDHPNADAIRSKGYIAIRPSTDYYVYVGTSKRLYAFYYNSNKEFIERINIGYQLKFTTNANAAFMRFCTRDNYGGTYLNNISINYPSKINYYVPHDYHTVYGGKLTVNNDGSGEIVVDSESYTANGTETIVQWAHWGQTPNIAARMWINNGKPGYALYVDGAKNAMCNMLEQVSNIEMYKATKTQGVCVNNEGAITVQVEGVTTLEEMTAWLTANTPNFVFKLASPLTYSITASQVQTLLGTNHVWSDAGQLSLTYTGTDEHLVLTTGRKYMTRINGTDSMVLGAGQEVTAVKGRDNMFDLTQMFGTAVADYVYQQGAGYFRRWFGGSHYAYNAGELLSVEGLQSHDTVGFNQWDEEWELGYLNDTGASKTSTTCIRAKNYIPVIGGTPYYFNAPQQPRVCWYDAAYAFIRKDSSGTTLTAPTNAAFLKFYEPDEYGTTYNHDICINLSHNASRNGEYHPYEKHSYPLDSTLTLRGIPKVGSNGVYWDGDEYGYDGTGTRKYGEYTITGNEGWQYYAAQSYFYTTVNLGAVSHAGSNIENAKMVEYLEIGALSASVPDRVFTLNTTSHAANNFYIKDTRYNGNTIADFKAHIAGMKLVYKLATPTDETAAPYQQIQQVDDWGTEKFVSTSIVPVGHETRYPANLRDKLQHLPALASANGSYLITQTDGQMVLSPFPAPPTAAGNYLLKATVSGGNATYSWVAQ